ncbi:MAG: phosphatidate cytidylyltransferase, partial [Clostridiales bacterium]|nr:phosphatidate cytidylyltransferase [Clostridiales bacterium]
ISQIGDLAMSVIKRRYGVKDFGRIFPGHGGVLDRFDSVLLTAPVLVILSQIPAVSALLV